MNDLSVQKITIPINATVVWHDLPEMQQRAQVHLQANASLIWIHEYSLDNVQDNRISLQFFLGENSSLQYIPIFHGGSQLDYELEVNLERGARASIAGAYSLLDKQNYAIRTRQQHYGKNATSILQFNGIAADKSLINYHGTIVVEKNACNTNASQENKTILWGSDSRALSIPALEVKTNEVQCAHGSAIGPINKEHIQYMQSRGIPLQEAQRLLLTSFFAETLAILKDEDVKMRIIAKLVAHLLEK